MKDWVIAVVLGVMVCSIILITPIIMALFVPVLVLILVIVVIRFLLKVHRDETKSGPD